MNHHSMSVDATQQRSMESPKTAKLSDFELGMELLLGVYLLPSIEGLEFLVPGPHRKRFNCRNESDLKGTCHKSYHC